LKKFKNTIKLYRSLKQQVYFSRGCKSLTRWGNALNC